MANLYRVTRVTGRCRRAIITKSGREKLVSTTHKLAEPTFIGDFMAESCLEAVKLASATSGIGAVWLHGEKIKVEREYLVIFFFNGSPDATDRTKDRYEEGPYFLALQELRSCDEGWDRVDLYDITGRGDELLSDIDLDTCGECVASANRKDLERQGY